MLKVALVFLLNMFLLQTMTAQQLADPCEPLKRERQAMEWQLHDWPNLAKYRQANARLDVLVEGETREVFLETPSLRPGRMKEYAAREGIGCVDYYSTMVNDQHGLKPELLATAFIRTRRGAAQWRRL